MKIHTKSTLEIKYRTVQLHKLVKFSYYAEAKFNRYAVSEK